MELEDIVQVAVITIRAKMRARGDLDVADPVTVRFKLKKPGSTLLAALSDRADMMVMVAPEAAEQARNKFGLNALVRIFPERVQQDHVTLARNPSHWNAKAFNFDKIVFRAIPDATTRLASLRSGDLVTFPSASILPTLGSSRWGRTYDRGLTLVEASIDLMGIGTGERARQ